MMTKGSHRTRIGPLWLTLSITLGLVALAAMAAQRASGADKTPSDSARELASAGADRSPAAIVNGHVISKGRVLAYASLAAQNQSFSGVPGPDTKAILDGLIDEELLYQEALRRGFEVSADEAKAAVASMRNTLDPKQQEFILSYANLNSGESLDQDSYWALPEVQAAYRRSLTIQSLVGALTRGLDPADRGGDESRDRATSTGGGHHDGRGLRVRSIAFFLIGSAFFFVAACGDGPDSPPTETALPTLTPLPNVGDCLNSQPVALVDVVPCGSASAFFKVLAIDRGTGERVCPPETDANSTWIGNPVSLCLEKLK